MRWSLYCSKGLCTFVLCVLALGNYSGVYIGYKLEALKLEASCVFDALSSTRKVFIKEKKNELKTKKIPSDMPQSNERNMTEKSPDENCRTMNLQWISLNPTHNGQFQHFVCTFFSASTYCQGYTTVFVLSWLWHVNQVIWSVTVLTSRKYLEASFIGMVVFFSLYGDFFFKLFKTVVHNTNTNESHPTIKASWVSSKHHVYLNIHETFIYCPPIDSLEYRMLDMNIYRYHVDGIVLVLVMCLGCRMKYKEAIHFYRWWYFPGNWAFYCLSQIVESTSTVWLWTSTRTHRRQHHHQFNRAQFDCCFGNIFHWFDRKQSISATLDKNSRISDKRRQPPQSS